MWPCYWSAWPFWWSAWPFWWSAWPFRWWPWPFAVVPFATAPSDDSLPPLALAFALLVSSSSMLPLREQRLLLAASLLSSEGTKVHHSWPSADKYSMVSKNTLPLKPPTAKRRFPMTVTPTLALGMEREGPKLQEDVWGSNISTVAKDDCPSLPPTTYSLSERKAQNRWSSYWWKLNKFEHKAFQCNDQIFF